MSSDGLRLVSDEALAQIETRELVAAGNDAHSLQGMCEICNVPMNFIEKTCSYRCETCGREEEIVGGQREFIKDKILSGTVRSINGTRRIRYSAGSDYAHVRFNAILNSLITKNNQYAGAKFSSNILVRTANIFNDILKIGASNIEGEKKILKKDNVKDDILGAILYEICRIEGTPRRKRDIAEFLNKSDGTKGIAEGTKFVRDLCISGKLHLDICTDDRAFTQAYTDRYLEALGIEKPEYNKFVVDLVEATKNTSIGYNSVINTKVAGAIWTLVIQEKLNKTRDDVERACDNIRANTFQKYSTAIIANILKFIKIFIENRIHHGYEGRIVKRNELTETQKMRVMNNTTMNNTTGKNGASPALSIEQMIEMIDKITEHIQAAKAEAEKMEQVSAVGMNYGNRRAAYMQQVWTVDVNDPDGDGNVVPRCYSIAQ